MGYQSYGNVVFEDKGAGELATNTQLTQNNSTQINFSQTPSNMKIINLTMSDILYLKQKNGPR